MLQLGVAHGAPVSVASGAEEELALPRIRARATHHGSASAEVVNAFENDTLPAVIAPTAVASHTNTGVIIAIIAFVATRFEASFVSIAPPANGDLAGRFAVPAEGFSASIAKEPET
jgi:hypothetical protein